MHPKNYIATPFVQQKNLGVIGMADKNKRVRYFTVYNTYKIATFFPFYDQLGIRLKAVPNFYD